MSRSIPLYESMSRCPVDIYPLQMALADLIWNPNLTMWYFLWDSLKWKNISSEYELPPLSLSSIFLLLSSWVGKSPKCRKKIRREERDEKEIKVVLQHFCLCSGIPLRDFIFLHLPGTTGPLNRATRWKKNTIIIPIVLYSKCKQIAACHSALLCLSKGK